MKIALINPPYFNVYKGYKKAAKMGANYPPTGLLYLASKLREDGHDMLLFDTAAEDMDTIELIQKIRAFDPNLIGITATTPTFCYASEIAREIKNRLEIPIVLGGIHVTIVREEALRDYPDFDYAVIGEGEDTISELVNCLEKGGDLAKIEGILYRNGEEIFATSHRQLNPNIDVFPVPARDLVKKENYTWAAPGKPEGPVTCVLSQRGCPFLCSFCSQRSMFGRRVRSRSVDNVMDELENIVKVQGISHISFADDTFSLNKSRIKQICEEIHSRKLDFTWECMCRANTVDAEILQTMANAGLVRLSFGIESGDNEILERIHKGITTSEIRQAYRWAKDANIETRGSAIIGHPNETRKSAWKTIRFLSSLKDLDQVYINIMVPYPGTEIFELAKNGKAGYRLLSDDYSNYIRYNNSVLEVNDLDVKTLKKLQRVGLWMFYLRPTRIIYNLKRSGIQTGFRMALAMLRGLFART